MLLTSDGDTTDIRSITSEHVSKLVQIPGIVIAASRVRAKSTQITLQCRQCHTTREVLCRPGMGGVVFPRRCDRYALSSNLRTKVSVVVVWGMMARRALQRLMDV